MPFDERLEILWGKESLGALRDAHVCVYGLGGVGATAAMDLVRSGIGRISVVDFDTVQESNLNRLYFGYADTVGMRKTEAFTRFAKNINDGVIIDRMDKLVSGEEAGGTLPPGADFFLDCIDTLNPKVNLIAALLREEKRFISSLGTAGRIRPEMLKIGPLWETHDCPLAQRVRQRLRRLGIVGKARKGKRQDPGAISEITCVWSDELAVKPAMPSDGSIPGTTINGMRIRAVQGSSPFVPQAAGHLMASYAVRRILGL